MYNLTNNQKDFATWLVEEVRQGRLSEEFEILWVRSMASPTPNAIVLGSGEASREAREITPSGLDALVDNDLLLCKSDYKIDSSGTHSESKRRCTSKGKLYEAVDSNFNAPDTSFIKHLTPLADISGMDEALKQRCLPILSAGGSDPLLWDSAVRTAGVILEERLRSVGQISDPNRTGRNLVNDTLGTAGTLASKFAVSSEREGYRELYAGVVGAFRNPSAHRLVDPSPEEGGAFILFINLLLKKLDLLK